MQPLTLAWGLVGYGDLAEKRVAAALKNSTGGVLRGVWGRNPEKAREFAVRHEIPQAHNSYAALLDSGISAVYICTPPDSHCDYALAAFEKGLHVLVEKPMAASSGECQRMIEAARQTGKILGVAYYRRAFPKMVEVKKIIESGELGEMTWVNIALHSWFSPEKNDPKYWRVEVARSGGAGALADAGVHRLDLLQYWLGESRVLFADKQHLVQEYEVEDGSSAILQLKNGAPVHTYFSWNSKTFLDRFEITGTEGKLIMDPLDGPELTWIQGREHKELSYEVPANLHQPCVDDFVAAVKQGHRPLCDGTMGLHTNVLLEQILRR
jgi:predicted dehydrogenase